LRQEASVIAEAQAAPLIQSKQCIGLSPDEEASLLARMKAGDQVGFAELVVIFGPQMMAVARRFMRSDEDCNDALQDAFISAFKAIAGFEANSRLATWLHRITVNSCLMKIRAASSRREMPMDDLPGIRSNRRRQSRSCSGFYHPADKIETDETRAAIRQAIDDLPEDHRTVLRLRYIDEINTAATAALLNTTENNVKHRLRRARHALSCRLASVLMDN
jgi:RNA polymerase sigma-70 factor, ECF subfamily